MATASKALGTVTSVVGEVKATASDGTVRILQVGVKVFSDEVITTSPQGSVNIAMEGAGARTLECGNDVNLALNEIMLGGDAIVALPTPAPAAPGADVAALQAAIAAGADPTQVAEATAAGAPRAGGPAGGGS